MPSVADFYPSILLIGVISSAVYFFSIREDKNYDEYEIVNQQDNPEVYNRPNYTDVIWNGMTLEDE